MQTATQNARQQSRPSGAQRNGSASTLARGLGWFSVGLGVAELVAPGAVARLIGVSERDRTRNLLRVYGARELAAGIGILAQTNPSPWLWARVAGDGLDLASLGRAMASTRTERARAGAATAAVLGVTALDVLCAQQMTNSSSASTSRSEEESRPAQPQITQSIIIEKSPEEIYDFWRDFSHLAQLSPRLVSVQVLDRERSHWTLTGPMGRTLEWDAQITEDEPNSRIAWRSLSATAPHSGAVRFERATGRRGTRVTVQIHLGFVGSNFGKLLGLMPEQQISMALHNLKQLLEVGEILRSEATVRPGMHPARAPQPSEMQSGTLGAAASA